MVSDSSGGKPRGYAFLEYEHERDMHGEGVVQAVLGAVVGVDCTVPVHFHAEGQNVLILKWMFVCTDPGCFVVLVA